MGTGWPSGRPPARRWGSLSNYAPNIAAGNDTVKVTFSQLAIYADIRILEYRGVTTLDAAVGASGSGSGSNSGSISTTHASELIFGADTISTVTSASGSGFTGRTVTSPDGDLAEDKIVSAAGSYSATASLISGAWVMQMATFSNAAPPLPGTLSQVSCTTNSFTGSGSDACTVSLSAAAGSGGLAVSLASNNSAVTVPASVTVPAGSSSAGFTATVSAVTTAHSATLTASAGGVVENYGISLNVTDTTPPTVSITSPSANATLTRTVTLTASASDNVAVASVQFQVDNTNAGPALISSPYNYSLDTTTFSNRSHTLTAVATDTAGYSAKSATLAVTLSNALAPVISGLSPVSGSPGTAVVITGSNFGTTQGTSTVTFNGTAGIPTSWGATGIIVPVPAGATTGTSSSPLAALPATAWRLPLPRRSHSRSRPAPTADTLRMRTAPRGSSEFRSRL